MATKIYTYSMASNGSKELARALGIKRIQHDRSRVVGSPDLTVINWGSSSLPQQIIQNGTRIINRPEQVAVASHKLRSFETFMERDVLTPDYTTHLDRAHAWLQNGHVVFARTILNGSSGDGIVIMDPEHPENHNTRARLYTRYVKKKDEFRVHVVNGQVIDTQRKGLRPEYRGHPDINWKVRNLANGFIFGRNDIQIPNGLHELAISAVEALRLDFGAVDIIYNEQSNRCYVLEVNTAPGLVGTTIQSYTNAFRNYVN